MGYGFEDGRNALDDTNSSLLAARFSTDSSGAISSWVINATTGFGPLSLGEQVIQIVLLDSGDSASLGECIQTECFNSRQHALDIASSALPGTWALVPEPSTSLLLATGLFALAAQRRRTH